jgi:hypothetical protein
MISVMTKCCSECLRICRLSVAYTCVKRRRRLLTLHIVRCCEWWLCHRQMMAEKTVPRRALAESQISKVISNQLGRSNYFCVFWINMVVEARGNR